ncbi:MAG: DUF523 domain-containing protein [Bacteroidales bacterium]|nr:DUF523 domain-containing protein [Bacteroidales bacterium]
MTILVSACLLGENCKYNGGNNLCENVTALSREHRLVSVCPECLGGLPTPRPCSEIVNGVVTNCEGIVVDKQFRKGAEAALQIALDNKVDIAILQPRSPSCGVHMVYDGTFSGSRIPGSGVFASMLKEHGINAIEPDELTAYFGEEQ